MSRKKSEKSHFVFVELSSFFVVNYFPFVLTKLYAFFDYFLINKNFLALIKFFHLFIDLQNNSNLQKNLCYRLYPLQYGSIIYLKFTRLLKFFSYWNNFFINILNYLSSSNRKFQNIYLLMKNWNHHILYLIWFQNYREVLW